MGRMEQAIKFEIIRLAKKQMRAAYVPLARNVRRLKRTVREFRKTVSFLAKLGAEIEVERTAARARLQVAPEEAKAARLSPGLIKKLRVRLGISQGELAVLVGVSTGAVGFWEQGKARPGGRNKEALVALRKLGKREMRRILAEKKAEAKPSALGGRKAGRRKARRGAAKRGRRRGKTARKRGR